MCCFPGHVSDVSATDIFARVDGERQYIAYQMSFSSDQPTAMILPIPVARDAGDDAVEFLALDKYPDFFRDLEHHFHALISSLKLMGPMAPHSSLKVERVGAFEASFVPSLDQFDRLDERFRIPDDIWRQVPGYESFGFVVFKLQPGTRVNVHPMAFSFPTRDPETVFFPTVHIHDGAFHEMADFDHVLYTQNMPAHFVSPSTPRFAWFGTGDVPARRYLRTRRTRGLVDPKMPCFQASLMGESKNSDILVGIRARGHS
jgi:hypothetical protein